MNRGHPHGPAVTRNRRCSSFDNTAVRVTQTTAQQWQDIPVPPDTGFNDGVKPEQGIALFHGLAQVTFQGNALRDTRWRPELNRCNLSAG